MIRSYILESGKMKVVEEYRENALWYDFLNLGPHEKKELEKRFQLMIPSQERMGKYGTSSIFKKGELLYLTIAVLARMRPDQSALFPVTFILHPKFLITVRTSEPSPFDSYKKLLLQSDPSTLTPYVVFFGIVEAIFDRISELTEKIDLDVDTLSQEIFIARTKRRIQTKKLGEILARLGNKGDLNSKVSESARSVERLLNYCKLHKSEEKGQQIDILQQGIHSILDHLHFLADKINFLLDACLGYITIEQNNIIKIFTILTMLLLPPSLIATLYGMNFKYMPELSWRFGYPFALCLMVVSALLPYIYFKRKGWL
jgi:magnesium transporter